MQIFVLSTGGHVFQLIKMKLKGCASFCTHLPHDEIFLTFDKRVCRENRCHKKVDKMSQQKDVLVVDCYFSIKL